MTTALNIKPRQLFFSICLCLPILGWGQVDVEEQLEAIHQESFRLLFESRAEGNKKMVEFYEVLAENPIDIWWSRYYKLKGDYFRFGYEMDSAFTAYRTSMTYGEKVGAKEEIMFSYHSLAALYSWENELDSAIAYEETAIKLAEEVENFSQKYLYQVSLAKFLSYQGKILESNEMLFNLLEEIPDREAETKGTAFTILAGNYVDLGIGNSVEEYYKSANRFLKKSPNQQLASNNMANLVNYYNDRERYEDALEYVDSIIILSSSDRSRLFYNLHKSSAYKGLEEWDLALIHIDSTLYYDRKTGDDYGFAADMITKGQIFLRKGDYQEALEILTMAKNLFEENGYTELTMNKQLYRDWVASQIHLKIPEIADDFYHFTDLYEEITSQGSDENLAEMEVKYEASNKDKQIALQALKIEKEKSKRMLMWSGFGLIFTFGVAGFWIYNSREKRKSLERKNTLLSLQQTLNEMELAGLNQRLNPHEIKNLLAAISPEIQEKAPGSYRQMLRLFNLTKASLHMNSLTESVDKQLQQVEDYLALMKTVMVEPLDYELDNQLDRENVLIPRFLLKNMVQNAIKHGIKGKEDGGHIKVSLCNQNGYDQIVIEDNGHGWQAKEFNSNGIGLSTYQKIFDTLNKKNHHKAKIEIDNESDGVKVKILVPVNYNYN